LTLRPSSSTVQAPQLEVASDRGADQSESFAQPVHEEKSGFDLILTLDAVHSDADPSHTSPTTDPRFFAAASGNADNRDRRTNRGNMHAKGPKMSLDRFRSAASGSRTSSA